MSGGLLWLDNMQNKTIVLVANGSLDDVLCTYIPANAIVVGVDKGAIWLLKHGFIPHIAIGDFDSVTNQELEIIKKNISEIETYPRQKDATDMELAFRWALRKKPEEIRILGGIGSRLDHSLATVQLLERNRKNSVRIVVFDTHNRMELVRGQLQIEKTKEYAYYSIIPATRFAVVSLKGFAYPLTKGVIRRGSTLGVSNELVDVKGTIIVHEGRVWLIGSRD